MRRWESRRREGVEHARRWWIRKYIGSSRRRSTIGIRIRRIRGRRIGEWRQIASQRQRWKRIWIDGRVLWGGCGHFGGVVCHSNDVASLSTIT